MSEKETKQSRRPIPPSANPCDFELQASIKCLMKYDKDKYYCKEFIDNAKNCEKFWKYVYDDRKRRGIQPYLPPPEHRQSIRETYAHAMKEIFK